MANIFTYIFNLQANNNKVIAQFNGVREGIMNVNNSFTTLQKKLETIRVTSVVQQFNYVADGLNSLTGGGMQFNHSLAELSAITGVTGNKLQEIGKYARNSSKEFGTSATQGVQSYALILSKLNPEIAKTPEALSEMGKIVNVLSKQMGGDTVSATETLTTALNQFQISTDNPILAAKEMSKMMNVMAAAAQAGSAELPQIKEALEQSGLSAKMAGVSFEETNAAIQVLDKAGKKGAEGGVALRNVMATLAQGRFLPPAVISELQSARVNTTILTDKNKTLHERLSSLKGVMNDGALFTKLFGRENANAAIALVSQTDTIKEMTGAITGTNSAYEQAAIIMDSPQEKANKLQAKIDSLKISIFNATGGVFGYLGVLGNLGRDIANLIPLYDLLKGTISGAINVIKFITSAEKMKALWDNIVTVSSIALAAAQVLVNEAMNANPIIKVVGLVLILAGVIVLLWNKSEGFRKVVMGVWEVLKSFGSVIKDYVINRIKELLNGITGLGKSLMLFFSGNWKEAWETGKNAMIDLSGINSGSEALKGVYNAGTKISENFEKGKQKGAESWAKSQSKLKATTPNSGITAPTIPGTTPIGAKPDGDKDAGNKTNEAIATGGTKNTTVNITIGNLVKDFKVTASGIKETNEQVMDNIIEAVSRAVSMGAALGS